MACNPLSIITGDICPHYKICKKNCVLSRIRNDESIITSNDSFNCESCSCEKVLIIGSGPAGLAAAHTLRKHGFDVTVCEHYDKLGGALRLIPDSRLDKKHIDNTVEQLSNMGVVFKNNCSTPTLDEFDFIVVAVGTWKPRKLGIKGEDLEIVTYALDYLKNPTTHENAIVIGAGEVAADCAKQSGGKIYYRGPIAKMKGEKQDDLSYEFEIFPKQIQPDGVLFEQHGKEIFVPCDKAIIAIGQLPDLPAEIQNLENVIIVGDAAIGSSNIVKAVLDTKLTLEHKLNKS